MRSASARPKSLIAEIWHSYRSLPGWVQIWVAFVLVPVNAASVAFMDEPMGVWVAMLANGAMLANLPVMLHERGFSKLMAVPHLLPWSALLVLIIWIQPLAGAYGLYLWGLFATDLLSLMFDYPDAVKWWRGERGVAGR
ncbi:hypothetical protein [Hoeflea ulvae]|uniref:Uncharacterized protein n=1 Tax=Hoeflea ulvae TaxID=2983764 RepID=A0ABT3YF44_9HYPH|nr:hypothetical protein [Hoeflea ulvae]MCY0094524.1 hypothetical protein [Hoeflea ulvae]